ncbi:hypothetical protein BDW75DRAFT_241266 [Aspergillus navahoensis]
MFFRDGASVINGETVVTGPTTSTPKPIEGAATDAWEKFGEAKIHATNTPSREVTIPTIRSEIREPIAKNSSSGANTRNNPIRSEFFFLPIQLLFNFPAMFFSGLLVGGILAWYNVVIGSLALILGNAP